MVFYATYNSPLGSIVIESDGETITGLRFVDEDTSVGKTDSNEASSTMPVIAATIRWLDDYFSGKQTENATIYTRTENGTMGNQTDVQIVVKPKGTMFQQRIWQVLLTIPYGDTVGYGEIAKMVGCRSAQAVGQAVGANPIAILIPCHRVIAANGKLGGYAYGEERKRRLLAWEQQSKFKTSVGKSQ
ncbi:MAG: methylated-DNA--[Paludibacteraceae bacterium]|nr:methylated-DNA--[protein]-cysteine S-methyltransferase [Paludibacteraceae bacterium]